MTNFMNKSELLTYNIFLLIGAVMVYYAFDKSGPFVLIIGGGFIVVALDKPLLRYLNYIRDWRGLPRMGAEYGGGYWAPISLALFLFTMMWYVFAYTWNMEQANWQGGWGYLFACAIHANYWFLDMVFGCLARLADWIKPYHDSIWAARRLHQIP